jgi:hypothetical protein
MIRITVASDQARMLREGQQPLEVVDEHGNAVGCYWKAFTSEEVAEARRRSAAEPGGRTTKEILERLSGMELK